MKQLTSDANQLTPARWVGTCRFGMLAFFSLAVGAQAQTVDSFNPGATGGYVESLAVQPDGMILAGGVFTTLAGRSRPYLGRLLADGVLDESFAPDASWTVNCMAVLTDGKALVGGGFTSLGGKPRDHVGLLQVDGTLDDSFNTYPSSYNYLNCLLRQPDGNILIGGTFGYVRRLNANGTPDASFAVPVGGGINCLAMQDDGKILVGGGFTSVKGQSRAGIARLHPNGTLDTGFNPGVSGQPTTSWGQGVFCMIVQPDGQILVAGNFYNLAGRPHQSLGRLNPDGTLETNFTATAGGMVHTLGLQADGKILIAGSGIWRANSDGTRDTNFSATVGGGSVIAVTLQRDGKILLGGEFTSIYTKPPTSYRSRVARLVNTEAATESLGFDGTSITWLRSGTAPEVWHTTFDYTTNGGTWFDLGAGVRIPGGWQLSGVSFPAGATLRACGFIAGGHYNASGTVIETFLGPPVVIAQPLNRTNNALTTAGFSLMAGGGGSLSYQWFKDGQPLTNGSTTFGAHTPALIVSNVLGADQGFYWATVSNSDGVATSRVAALSVVDPVITRQPTNFLVTVGRSASFQVGAAGTAPLAYQWRHDGVPVPGATEATWNLTNAQPADAGSYTVTVSNSPGFITSTAAVLSVNTALADTLNPGANNIVHCLALERDGDILLGGTFSAIGGQTRTGCARLNQGGALDTSFNPTFAWADGSVATEVHAMSVQEDGRIVVLGGFDRVGGLPRTNFARLNPNGSVDATFAPQTDGSISFAALQPDGCILVGGVFTTINGQPSANLARLNPNGTVDGSFQPGFSGGINALVVQPDGKILVGGRFSTINGVPRLYLGRLEASGALDLGFDAHFETQTVSGVACLALLGGDQVLVGRYRPAPAAADLVRLNHDGGLDPAFVRPAIDSSGPSSMAVQTDGKIVLGGGFASVTGVARYGLARLEVDGALEPYFTPGSGNTYVDALALQADGSILAGGLFNSLAGEPRQNLGRLSNSPPLNETFSFDGTRLSWLRSGAGPEFSWTTFAHSTNGTDWLELGGGVRISGGWQRATASLPLNAVLRARGLATGGCFNWSCWFVESSIPVAQIAPVILMDDGSLGFHSGQFGFNISGVPGQTVVTEGSSNLVEWLPLGTNTLSSAPLLFQDPNSSFPARFYRLRLQ